MSQAVLKNLLVVRGTTKRLKLVYSTRKKIENAIDEYEKIPIDLTGFDVEFQCRSDFGSKKLYVRKHNNDIDPLGSGIFIDAKNGVIELVLQPDDTQKIKGDESIAEFRLFKPNGDIQTLLFCKITSINAVISRAGL